MEETASVKISRKESKFTRRKFDVYIDDHRRIGILNGETTTIQVTPGQHTLKVKSLSWIKSEDVVFSADEAIPADLECGYHGKRLVFLIIGLVLVIFAVDVAFLLVMTQSPAGNSLAQYRWYPKILIWVLYFILISRPGMILYAKKSQS